ncbi:MAG: hypothetical protein LUE11_03190 [Clostridia bacterium]|nr:hypothetical protein [Clostridia bacterium]
MITVLMFLAMYGLLICSPLAGFALLDILKCIRDQKTFWKPSMVVIVIFFWALGWASVLVLTHI